MKFALSFYCFIVLLFLLAVVFTALRKRDMKESLLKLHRNSNPFQYGAVDCCDEQYIELIRKESPDVLFAIPANDVAYC